MINPSRDKMGGFNCPVCGSFIPTSMQELITSLKLVCPMCNLELSIDQANSQRAISAMTQVMEAQNNLDKASRFDGK